MSDRADETDELSRIGALVRELVEIAPWWSGFWCPLPLATIEHFEGANQISLPDDFRRLLLEVGDRAPIPWQTRGGFLPLLQAQELTTASTLLGPLSENFAHSGASEARLGWDEERDDYCETLPLRGLLPIGDGGCDVTYHLVVSGEDRGRVWVFAPSGDPELTPTCQDLLVWYRTRLDTAMQPLRRAADEERLLTLRVSSDASDLVAAIDLGRRRLLIDTRGATDLIEQSWLQRDQLPDEHRRSCMRAVAELDLVNGRLERIAAMDVDDDPLLRCYAGIAAARDQRWDQAEHWLSGKLAVPGPMRTVTAIYQALAAMHRAAHDQAIAILTKAPASAYGYHLLAQAYGLTGHTEEALRVHRYSKSGHERHPLWQPHRPTIAERLMPALPSIKEMEEAFALVQR